MKYRQVLFDTGPLIAIISKDDHAHLLCFDTLKSITPPLLCCWPVITEAAWLLRHSPRGLQQLFTMLEIGFVKLLPIDETSAPWLAAFFQKYEDQQPQLADACLMYLAEQEKLDTVFTLDRRDFSVYRLGGRRTLHLLP